MTHKVDDGRPGHLCVADPIWEVWLLLVHTVLTPSR